MKYGLLGKSVRYSLSQDIHCLFGNTSYEVKSVELEEFSSILLDKSFSGLNVTMPYKTAMPENVNKVDEASKTTGVINTIINREGTLYGYNTDCYGFDFLLKYFKVELENKKVAILGSGATCKSVRYVLAKYKINECKVFSKHHHSEVGCINEIYDYCPNIIINTTPVGSFNDVENSLIDFDLFKTNCVEVVIDVNYFPLKSKLLFDAETRKIKAINGLLMLVAQAYKAEEIFGNEVNKNEISNVYKQVLNLTLNIVLVGMPYSGKSYLGRQLAKNLKKSFIDTDEIIEQKVGCSCKEFIVKNGEEEFRNVETKVIKELTLKKNTVISCGGGAILNKENVRNLKSNAIVYWIKKNVDSVYFDNSRPLCTCKEDYLTLYFSRKEDYDFASDFEFENGESLDPLKEMGARYYEVISR